MKPDGVTDETDNIIITQFLKENLDEASKKWNERLSWTVGNRKMKMDDLIKYEKRK